MSDGVSSPARAPSRGVSRRALLRGAGIGAAGLAVSPWLKHAAALQAEPSATDVGGSAWYELANRLRGRLLMPRDISYPGATIINATRYMRDRPAGIAICAAPEDAAVSVTWARDNGVPFAVRSGGHNYGGFSNSDGLVIDVKGMRSVTVDPAVGTATVAGGANNADVGEALKPYGVYFPGGRCPTVGVSGLTLGGGWGFSNRYLGMTCDSLVSTEIVTASGDIVTASEAEHPDLFWAVRGGAGGNFGVHTSFTFNVVPTQDVTVFQLSWSGGGTPTLIDAIIHMQLDGPRELGFRVAVRSQSRMPLSQPAPLDVDLIGLYWGPLADVEELLAPVERVQPAESRAVAGMKFPAALGFLSATTPVGAYQVKTGFVQGALPAEGIVTMLEGISTMPGVPSRSQESTAKLYCWGGKVNDLAPDANAFVHRNAEFLFASEVLWEPEDDVELVIDNLNWIEAYHTAMQPYLSGGAYQNFTDRSQSDWPRAYYGENLERLVEIKRIWDPDNLFQFPQSIPTTL